MTDQVTGASSATTAAEPLALRSNGLLGPLPAPEVHDAAGYRRAYTADQMRAYAAQEVAAERERWASLVCNLRDARHRYGWSPEVDVEIDALTNAMRGTSEGQETP